MACPFVPKSLFSETKRSTRLLLNFSDVYNSPAHRTSRLQHGAFRPYPNDNEHKLAFIPSPRQTLHEYGLPIGRHWWQTSNGDCHWPRRGLSRVQTLFSINHCIWLRFGFTKFICIPAIKTVEWHASASISCACIAGKSRWNSVQHSAMIRHRPSSADRSLSDQSYS